jgi:putative tryptophan/tyrosine transport system substrate-binding protein
MVKKTIGVFGILMIAAIILASYLLNPPLSKSQLPKVGVLAANDLRLTKVEGLKASLNELGFSEESEVSYQIENAQNNLSELTRLGERLVEGKPDVLVAAGAVEAQVLKELTAKSKLNTPIVFMGTLSPVEIGLVENTVRPGKNLTGLNNYHYELTPKRLELLHRLLPGIKKVAVLGDTRVPFFEKTQSSLTEVAEGLGLELQTFTVSSSDEIQKAFFEMQEAGMEGIVLLPGFFLETITHQIVDLALQRKLPVFGVYPRDTEEGCLASYGTSNWSQGEQSAHIVSKVLHGQEPQDIPVETPDQIIFSVNLKTAEKLGVTPSPGVLSFADQVVQP